MNLFQGKSTSNGTDKPHKRGNLWSPWLVLLTGLAFTSFLTVQLWREVRAKEQSRFEMEMRRATGNIQRRLETYISMLRGGTGLFAASEFVTLDEFRTYVACLELPTKYPGIQGIGFARRVAAAERAEFERDAFAAGIRGAHDGFHIWPDNEHEESYAIMYLEPMDDRNQAAIGYDMFSEPVRREAMERARDTAAPAASGKLTLVQEIDPDDEQSGFLIYMPVYADSVAPDTVDERRAAIEGFVYSPFRTKDLLRGALGMGGRPLVDFEVYDGEEIDPSQLLHQSHELVNGRLHGTGAISVAGRIWTLQFAPSPRFSVGSDSTIVPVTAFIGATFSLALFGFSLAQVLARRSAEDRRIVAQAESEKRRAAEEFLLREKNFTDAIVNCLPGIFYVVEKDGRYRRWNATLERVTGHTSQEVAHMQPRDLFHPENHPLVDQRMREFFQQGSFKMEAPLYTADGREIPYLFTGVRTTIDGRECLVGLALDITEQHESRQALARTNQRLELAQRAGKIGSFEWNLRTDHITWSAMEEQLYGLPAGSFDGTFKKWLQLVHPDDREVAQASVNDAIAKLSELHIEFRIVRPDGAVRWLLAQGIVISDGGAPQRMVGVNVDITERKLAEVEAAQHRDHLEDLVAERTTELEQTHQRLRLSERLAALGTLSAGLGHDMGNLLLPMRLRLDAMESRGVSAEAREDVSAIRKCAEYLQRLVNGLRLFGIDPNESHASAPRTDVLEWWDDVKPFLHNALPRHVTLERMFAPGLPPLKIPRHLLTQAVFNLVQNAGDALRGSTDGTVRVWAEPASDPAFVRVGVSDDGAGMSADTLRRCMEPFFTTKVRGLSTGLGLSLVHGIIHNLGGQVQIQSKLGRGTIFTMLIPVAEPARPEIETDRPRALVSLSDGRLQAFVTTVLQTMMFDVAPVTHPDNAEASVWVTEPREDLAEDLQQFLLRHPRRRALIFGDSPADLGHSAERVLTVEPYPRPAIIREALHTIASDVRGKGRHTSDLNGSEKLKG